MPHQQCSLPAGAGEAPCALRCSHRPFLQHCRALKSGARATRSRSVQQYKLEASRAQPTEAADEVVDLHSFQLLRACSELDLSAMMCRSQRAPDVLQSTAAAKCKYQRTLIVACMLTDSVPRDLAPGMACSQPLQLQICRYFRNCISKDAAATQHQITVPLTHEASKDTNIWCGVPGAGGIRSRCAHGCYSKEAD